MSSNTRIEIDNQIRNDDIEGQDDKLEALGANKEEELRTRLRAEMLETVLGSQRNSDSKSRKKSKKRPRRAAPALEREKETLAPAGARRAHLNIDEEPFWRPASNFQELREKTLSQSRSSESLSIRKKAIQVKDSKNLESVDDLPTPEEKERGNRPEEVVSMDWIRGEERKTKIKSNKVVPVNDDDLDEEVGTRKDVHHYNQLPCGHAPHGKDCIKSCADFMHQKKKNHHAVNPFDHRAHMEAFMKNQGMLAMCSLVVIVYIGVGMVGCIVIEGWTVIESFYFSMVTLSTVGYGDLAPESQGGKIFVTLYVMMGIGLIAAALGIVGEYVMDKLDGDEDVVVSPDVFWTPAKKKLAFSGLSILLLFVLGVVFLMTMEDLNVVDAIYLSTVTLTTVGYGDHAPETPEGQFVAALWIGVGTLVVARGIAAFIDTYLEAKQAKMRKKILKKFDLNELFSADDDGSGTVTESEFLVYKMCQMGLVGREELDEILAQFRALDTDGNGELTKEEAIAHQLLD